MLYFKSPSSAAYQTLDSVGFDIPSMENATLSPGEFVAVSTGLFFDVEKNREVITFLQKGNSLYIPELQIRSRSGLALKAGVAVLNSPGTIDPLYAQEIKVILINHSIKDFYIWEGDRIAQGVFSLAYRGANLPVLESERVGGFGSTGV